MPMPQPHRRAFQAAMIVSIGFGSLGVLLPAAYESVVFAPYRDALEAGTGGGAPELDPARVMLLGIAGGSIAGKWVAHLALLDRLRLTRAAWAWWASAFGLASWFVVDTMVSLAHGAWWNLAYVNLLPLALFVPLLAHLRLGTVTVARQPAPVVVQAVLVLGAGSGLVIALLGTTQVFAPWHTAFDHAVVGAESPAADRLLASLLGPIGGCTVAHFVMLFMLARHAWDRKAILWSIASLLAWFVVDSSWSISQGGGFNVRMINLPIFAVTLAVIGWSASTIQQRAGPTDGS